MSDRSALAPDGASGATGYLDFPAIIAGALIATAIAFVFAGFGAALGMSFISPYEGEGSATAAMIAVGVWMLWTTISSFMVGGYVAGRMRRRADGATEDEAEIRDGIHGLTMWAIGALLGAVVLSSTVTTTAKVAGSALESAASATGSAMQGAASLAGSAAGAVGSVASGAAGLVGDAASALPTDGVEDAMDYFSSTVFRTAEDVPVVTDDVTRDEVMTVLAKVARDGELSESDTRYVANLVAANTELAPEEASDRIDAAVRQVKEAREEAIATYEQAKQEAADTAAAAEKEAREAAAAAEQAARDAADQARIYALISGFVLAAALLIGAAAAFWAACEGGRHRDEGTIIPTFTPRF